MAKIITPIEPIGAWDTATTYAPGALVVRLKLRYIQTKKTNSIGEAPEAHPETWTRTDPIIFNALVQTHDTNGRKSRRFNYEKPPMDSEYQLEVQERTRAAAVMWKALRPWKKTRWTLCAYRQGIPTNPLAPTKGYGGFTLYLECFTAQHTVPPHQPISPCSRRATDAEASPNDWTP